MYRIRRKFRFEAAHQLSCAYSKACVEQIHGHSYVVEVFLCSKELNKDGVVMDFGELKALVKPVIDTWDHSIFVHYSKAKRTYHRALSRNNENIRILEYNPTAENMARSLFSYLWKHLDAKGRGVQVEAVRIHETESGWAEYSEKKGE